ncbi:hypothetical protein CR513_33904, partial [Mucuna pruriens]
MAGQKFEIEKFNGTKNFSMWQRRMKDVLIQQKVHKALAEKPVSMTEDDWDDMNEFHSAEPLRLSLAKSGVQGVQDGEGDLGDAGEAVHVKEPFQQVCVVEGAVPDEEDGQRGHAPAPEQLQR